MLLVLLYPEEPFVGEFPLKQVTWICHQTSWRTTRDEIHLEMLSGLGSGNYERKEKLERKQVTTSGALGSESIFTRVFGSFVFGRTRRGQLYEANQRRKRNFEKRGQDWPISASFLRNS